MDAGKRSKGLRPFEFVAETRQSLRLSILQEGKRLHDPVAKRLEKFGEALARALEHVARELPVVGTLFDDSEIVDLVETLPNFNEQHREKLAKQRPDADIREVIAPPSDRRAPARIIPVRRVIQCLLHKPGKWNRSEERRVGKEC